MGDKEHPEREEQAAVFPCQACGGQMEFDIASQMLKCRYCGNEKPIAEGPGETPVEHELNWADESDAAMMDWGMEQQVIKCDNCGGEMLLPARQTATVCGFCGSPKVLSQGSLNSIRPEFVIPFRVSKEQAGQAFQTWRRKKWFIPNEFKKQSVASNLNGIYVPFWTYDAQTASSYRAEVGVYHYRQEIRTRTVNGKTETYTENVRYTVWHWTSGNYEHFFDDLLIPASGQYDSELLHKLHDYQLDQLTAYKPEYLSGFMAERYSVSLKDGWEQAAARITARLRGDIRSLIGGDEIRNLDIDTSYSDRTYKHILLPVWNASYRYKDKTYRYMVNGETKLVTGYVPRSPWKIAGFVLCCLIVVSVVVVLCTQRS
ncbi:hypothetical protein GXP70_24680 [Paenibacillus lycopersici]|uniref:TFIIB-type zinc ribbon-containing protein n=1 Tax=Paenibacillus lycopersici TaxID=2704462 RepID=A0A6C0G5G6_9BACL|nr:hypothetical protein [Paenibacillus lycopersici]QHT62859.1 hypothetical protein GXP70_24680 [Paenibacillus lycopersici]